MNHDRTLRIETAAAKAVADWKALFADEVAETAKELAARDHDARGLVRLEHYRQAAVSALQVLANAVKGDETNDGRQEAA